MKRLVCLLALMTASVSPCFAFEPLDKEDASIHTLGTFSALPMELIHEIISISPIEIRAVNKTFYFLSSGYKAPGLIGVETPPQEKSDYFAGNPQWSITFDFEMHNIQAVPSAVWYRLIKEVENIPLDYMPCLKNTQIHTLYINNKTLEKLLNSEFLANNGFIKPNVLKRMYQKADGSNELSEDIRTASRTENYKITLFNKPINLIVYYISNVNRELLLLGPLEMYEPTPSQNRWFKTMTLLKKFFNKVKSTFKPNQ